MNYEASRDVLIHITTQQKHSPLLIEACFIQVLLDHWIYCSFRFYLGTRKLNGDDHLESGLC